MMKKLSFILLAVAFALNAMPSPKHDIEVTAFYSDFIYKYDSLPDNRWAHHPFVQLRIRQTFNDDGKTDTYRFKHYSWLNDLVPDYTVSNATIYTDSGIYHAKGAGELIKRINERDYGTLRQVTYSMATQEGLGVKYIPQALYAMPTFDTAQSWLISGDSTKDSLRISFNIDPTLFYIRSSKRIKETDGTAEISFGTNEEEPAFYLFYLPAYKHFEYKEDGRVVDLLAEQVDSAKSGPETIVYKQPDAAEDKRIEKRLKKTISALDKYIGRDASPDSIFVIKSCQALYRKMGDVETRATFSRAHRDNKYSLILLDNSDYETHTLMHEMLHTYMPDITKDNDRLYEFGFFSESLVEFLTCRFYRETFGENVFDQKIRDMLENKQDRKKARELLRENQSNGVSLAGKEKNTSWIYYDLLPLLIEVYAEDSGREQDFTTTVIDYLKKPDNEPSFKSFDVFMKERGFNDCLHEVMQLAPKR